MLTPMNKMLSERNLVCPRGCGSFRGKQGAKCPACGSADSVPQAPRSPSLPGFPETKYGDS